MKLFLSLFSARWKTYFFWGLFLGLVHLFGSNLDIDNLSNYAPWICKLQKFGDQQFVATITEVYAGLYALGIPLIFGLLEKAIKDYKTKLAREYVMHNREVLFFVQVTPIFLLYSVTMLFVGEVNDYHILILYLLVFISFFRFFLLARFYIRVLRELPRILSAEADRRLNKIVL